MLLASSTVCIRAKPSGQNPAHRIDLAARCRASVANRPGMARRQVCPLVSRQRIVKTQCAVGVAEQQLLVCHAFVERARQHQPQQWQREQQQRQQQQLRGFGGIVRGVSAERHFLGARPARSK
jgi:hypothetical protein